MPKISELTVADLRGARDMIVRHLSDVCGVQDTSHVGAEMVTHATGIQFRFFAGGHNDPNRVWITEGAEYDGDWTEFLDLIWKRVGQIPRAEVREIRAVMEALGSAIEILDKSTSEFAADLAAGIKQARDDAGARLIEYQQAAE